VVIGGSGGIGAALVKALLAGGAATVHSLSRSGAPSSAQGVVAGTIDIAQSASIESAAARVRDSGPVDLVLVATGLLHDARVRPEKSYRDLSAESLAAYFAINATGPALVARHFLPQLPRQGRAVFACLSARVGSIGDNQLGGWYGYRASKAALNMLIKSLAIELRRTRPDSICVALHPGTVDTGLSAPFQGGITPDKLFTPEVSAAHLLGVIASLKPEQSGGCYAWDGKTIVA
jgi:NAD(P)-dependent dehydrogenase (short-subunit alcohol dehydrogenase family)